jgi:hypothetical protein
LRYFFIVIAYIRRFIRLSLKASCNFSIMASVINSSTVISLSAQKDCILTINASGSKTLSSLVVDLSGSVVSMLFFSLKWQTAETSEHISYLF